MKESHRSEQVVSLMSSLGASPKSLARDKRSLAVMLSRSPSSLFRLVAFLSSDAVCMRVKNIGPFIRKTGCVELLDAICPTMHSLLTSEALDDELNILTQPAMAVRLREQIYSTYLKIRTTADALRDEIGVENMGKLLSAYPGVLLLNPLEHIFPITDFLYNDLGISGEDVPKVLQSYPGLLKADIDKMRETVAYLTELEVAPDAQAKIFRAFPAILSINKESEMEPVVEFLREIGVVNIGRFVT